MSRGIKMWGRGADGADGNKLRSLSTIYQEFPNGQVPVGSAVTLSGYGLHSSSDPLAVNNEVYLVIKCFDPGFNNLCNNSVSAKITSATQADEWVRYEVTVPSLPAGTTILQAGMEFHECTNGPCQTTGGAIFFDNLMLTY